MKTATATRRPRPAPAPGAQRLVAGLLALVASFCSFGPISGPATVGATFDDAHIVAASAERQRRCSHRVRRRNAHPVRRQARRRSRCLAHATRTVHQLRRHVAAPTGPPVRRGPPAT